MVKTVSNLYILNLKIFNFQYLFKIIKNTKKKLIKEKLEFLLKTMKLKQNTFYFLIYSYSIKKMYLLNYTLKFNTNTVAN